ncbi:DoxX family protein [Paraflavitalea pollutisoli]|uniref:DoxX family protein n=1 Tax=Paraflavitalea pollutisoli TaxID=3034143 RepID=UPI0023EC212C|nr:DoxX family protein [Paraflavitalea sp. H1-2-19X]
MSKRNKIIYWIATIWLCLGMTATGMVQMFKFEGQDDFATKLGYPSYFVTILGVFKILGVVAVLIPKFPLVKEWAYAGFAFAMTGAIFSQLGAGQPVVEIFPALLLLVLTIVSWYFRPADRKLALA